MASYPRRRSYGSGSVYRTASGRWRGALVVVDPATGTRSRRTVSGPTAADTRRRLDELRAAGTPSTLMRTGDWLALWLPTTRDRVVPSTYRGYEAVIRGIDARIGDVPLGALTPSDVERMTTAIVADGRTARTATMARKVLRLALRQAIRDKLVTRNVAAEARPPRVVPYQARTLTAEEARRLITTTATDELGPLWALLLGTGLRQGEALGLSWADVDLAAGTLSVRRSLTRGRDGRLELGPPKSDRSRRTIALPTVARDALDQQRIRQDAHRVAAGTAWQDRSDLVFTDTVGRPLVGRYVTPALRTALARAELPPIRCAPVATPQHAGRSSAMVPSASSSGSTGASPSSGRGCPRE